MQFKYTLVIIFFICSVLAIYNTRDKYNEEPLPNLETKINEKSQNYILQDNRIVPLTVLSAEDAKKPCKACHKFGD